MNGDFQPESVQGITGWKTTQAGDLRRNEIATSEKIFITCLKNINVLSCEYWRNAVVWQRSTFTILKTRGFKWRRKWARKKGLDYKS